MRPTRNRLRTAFLPCLAALAIAALTGEANAQFTSAQQSAMKQSCRSDFMSHCSGVSPGGKDALACLQKNVASLSPACQQAVSATMPPPAAPAQSPAEAAPAPAAPAPAAAKAAPPPAAAKAVAAAAPAAAKAKTKMAPAVVAPAAAAVAAPAVVAAPAAGPTPQQLSAVKHTCGSDFKRHCPGVQPGGPEALACLQRNSPRLTPDCKTSLAAIADVMPVAATPVAVPVAAPAVEPARPLPPGITPAGHILRRVIKRERELER